MITRDLLWKGIIEDCFDDLLTYFYPRWSMEVDFNQGFEFLDQELELIQLFPDAESHPRFVDKLVKVYTTSGEEKWVLVHVEVQGYVDATFAERMFIYFYRIFDRFRRPVTALALLVDPGKQFHPSSFDYGFLNTRVKYTFDTFKLLEKTEEDFLAAYPNPFSIILQTAWHALNTKGEASLLENKITLARRLLASNYPRHKIKRLLDFLRFYLQFDLIENNHKFEEEIQTLEKKKIPMGITELIENAIREEGIELGRKEGLKEGREEGLKLVINISRLSNQGQSTSEIAKTLEIPLDLVEEVKAQLQQRA